MVNVRMGAPPMILADAFYKQLVCRYRVGGRVAGINEMWRLLKLGRPTNGLGVRSRHGYIR